MKSHRNESKTNLLKVIFFLLLVFFVQFFAAKGNLELHDLLMNLYYIPVLLGGYYFGFRGAIFFIAISATASGIHVYIHSPNLLFNYLLQIVIFCITGALMGYLSDLQKTAIGTLIAAKLEFQKALSSALDAKDPYTEGHSFRVAQYAIEIAEEIGFTSSECRNLYQAALLHDIGKIGLSDTILKKNGKLTGEEYHEVTNHPIVGVKILENITFFIDVIPGIRHHHEKMDGSGYPDKIAGNNIPLPARIICIADAFDAMTTDRVYRKKKDPETAKNELVRCKGTQFDSILVDAFVTILGRKSIPSILETKRTF